MTDHSEHSSRSAPADVGAPDGTQVFVLAGDPADANAHVAGPDSCTTAEVFGSLEGVFRVLAEGPDGVREYDFLKGESPDDYLPLV